MYTNLCSRAEMKLKCGKIVTQGYTPKQMKMHVKICKICTEENIIVTPQIEVHNKMLECYTSNGAFVGKVRRKKLMEIENASYNC